ATALLPRTGVRPGRSVRGASPQLRSEDPLPDRLRRRLVAPSAATRSAGWERAPGGRRRPPLPCRLAGERRVCVASHPVSGFLAPVPPLSRRPDQRGPARAGVAGRAGGLRGAARDRADLSRVRDAGGSPTPIPPAARLVAVVPG